MPHEAEPFSWVIGDRPRLPITVIRPPQAEAEVWPGPILAADFDLEGIDVYANTDCPYLCDHCFLTTQELHTRDRMTTETVADILQWSTGPGSKIQEITLLGGEFSIHPQAAEIVKMVGNARRIDGSFLRPRIVTNGGKPFHRLLEDDEVARILQNSRVAVSIEAADPVLNDTFRSRGAAKNAWEAVDMLVERGIPVDINCTVMRSTMHDAMRLASYAYGRGARRINFHSFSPIGRGNNLQHEALSPQEWREFCDLMVLYKHHIEGADGVTDFVIDVEFAYDYGVPTGKSTTACAIEDGFNLQFRPPSQGGVDCAVLACGLTMPDPDKSAYVFRRGQLFQRYGDSEHKLVSTHKPRTCCPLPFRQQPEDSPQPICIYTRIDHKLADSSTYYKPYRERGILGRAALEATMWDQ